MEYSLIGEQVGGCLAGMTAGVLDIIGSALAHRQPSRDDLQACINAKVMSASH